MHADGTACGPEDSQASLCSPFSTHRGRDWVGTNHSYRRYEEVFSAVLTAPNPTSTVSNNPDRKSQKPHRSIAMYLHIRARLGLRRGRCSTQVGRVPGMLGSVWEFGGVNHKEFRQWAVLSHRCHP